METGDIGSAFDVPAIIRGLHQDLVELRMGGITVTEAKVRAEIAKQIFSGLRLVVQTQRYLSEKAKTVPAIEGGEVQS
ncbi:hypothetical protein SAMN05892877_11021 [Rhizobium subbaraonis]|uniref:Uncharacterized protein n=1 Tax=Rhizobium subbaraonis TaxID=908946 RepID=A0A285UKU6_9HYPH|nr:hypothetical protein [Rhizobium subbaraonis]SOC42479.1 hypothetical protein SAMN05892877_11021 [Rhizobium subbaraonis]